MRLRNLTIIQYQNVTRHYEAYKLWLSVDAFKQQLEYIMDNGFQVLTMDQGIQFMEKRHDTNETRPISLTFDNGFMAFYEEVMPLLTEHQLPATLLISPKKVGTSSQFGSTEMLYLTWNTLKEISEQGVTIGAYEDDSWNLNDISQKLVKEHIVDYKKVLEDKLGKEIVYYGVKEGVPSDSIRDLLISQGYRAFLTQCPTNRKPDIFSIGRIQVDDEDFNIFLTKISSTYLFFKDRRSWKYIREYSLDKAAHRVSEAYNRLKEKAHSQ